MFAISERNLRYEGVVFIRQSAFANKYLLEEQHLKMTELDSYPDFNVWHALGLMPPVTTSKGIDFTSDQIRKAWCAASLHWLGNHGSTMNVTMLGNPLRTSRRSSGRLLGRLPRGNRGNLSRRYFNNVYEATRRLRFWPEMGGCLSRDLAKNHGINRQYRFGLS